MMILLVFLPGQQPRQIKVDQLHNEVEDVLAWIGDHNSGTVVVVDSYSGPEIMQNSDDGGPCWQVPAIRTPIEA